MLASGYGAGHYFDYLIRRRLVLNIFLFAVSTAKLLILGGAKLGESVSVIHLIFYVSLAVPILLVWRFILG
jgi:hypothetical protein